MSGKEKRSFNRKKPFAEPGSATANWGSEHWATGVEKGGKQSEPLVAQLRDGSGSGSHSTLRDFLRLNYFSISLFYYLQQRVGHQNYKITLNVWHLFNLFYVALHGCKYQLYLHPREYYKQISQMYLTWNYTLKINTHDHPPPQLNYPSFEQNSNVTVIHVCYFHNTLSPSRKP